MPMEDVDRQLAAMGYDLAKVRAAADRFSRRAGLLAPLGALDGEIPPSVRPLAPRPAECADAAEHCYARRWRAGRAAAGVGGVALAALLALPIGKTVVTRWSGAMVPKTGEQPRSAGEQVKIAGADPAGIGRAPANNSLSAGRVKPLYRIKVTALKKCGAGGFKGPCEEAKPTSADGRLLKPGRKGKGVATDPDSRKPLQRAARVGHRPPSTG